MTTPKSAKEAEALGLRHYVTGRPCKRGHVGPRRAPYSACIECELARQARRKAENPEYQKEKARAYSYRKKGGKPAYVDVSAKRRKDSKKYYSAHRIQMRERHRAANLPPATRVEPLACECCGRTELSRALHLDHCHETNLFRGWLCSECNTSIGKLGDNSFMVARAVRYLQRAEAVTHPDVPPLTIP